MADKVRNIRELAAKAGLSVTTVSRVLNGKADAYRISRATSERVIEMANRYRYYPNRIARGLKLERTETIGLIIPDIANPFFASIAKTIETECRKNGYSIILCDSLDDVATEKELLTLLAGRKVDGIILAPAGTTCTHICDFGGNHIPLILIDRYFPGKDIPYVTTDNYSGAFMATDYLISMGHRNIACIQGTTGISSSLERVKGYADALRENGIMPDSANILGTDFGEENGYCQTHLLMSRPCRPTAIFALGNLISLGVLRALRESGLRIPEDISLVTFDEQPYSAYLASPLTTIEQPRNEIGKYAIDGLFDAIRSGSPVNSAIKIMVKPGLIVRESVKNMAKCRI